MMDRYRMNGGEKVMRIPSAAVTAYSFKYLSLVTLVLIFGGCSLMKADPAPDSGYIENPEKMTAWRISFETLSL